MSSGDSSDQASSALANILRVRRQAADPDAEEERPDQAERRAVVARGRRIAMMMMRHVGSLQNGTIAERANAGIAQAADVIGAAAAGADPGEELFHERGQGAPLGGGEAGQRAVEDALALGQHGSGGGAPGGREHQRDAALVAAALALDQAVGRQ